mmetsp:Transcript_70553/g.136157  ORF Transcript_70553/g.136157 Transcript_70553/m.136157 type:complete len:107 (+) Transcript_70553:1473-1793(+)
MFPAPSQHAEPTPPQFNAGPPMQQEASLPGVPHPHPGLGARTVALPPGPVPAMVPAPPIVAPPAKPAPLTRPPFKYILPLVPTPVMPAPPSMPGPPATPTARPPAV